jgi:hypothetical protein
VASFGRRRAFFIEEGTGGPCSFLTRAKGFGVTPGSLFTRTLGAPDEPASFFEQRRRVLGAAIDGGDPMMMPPMRAVLGVDEEDRNDDDTGASILRGT